jgi:hypothetical protein
MGAPLFCEEFHVNANASDVLDVVMGDTRLERNEREAVWRIHEAMMRAAEYLVRLREARNAS